ncbi:MAG TPA: hypothetical protein H9964_03780 [Candidatus Gallimonas intestinavium]|uniref:Uncharacterized protein n=1 Tax=Candidatus Gallimonas intestinavium TaxID=2838603 RepID=A0A9D2JYS7_9FIRM|nr:hypothetical protein [Candidatus Gallimonas intestinavium]
MKGQLISFTVKAALFLLFANLVMLFIVPFGTAEWYITVISAGLMAVLLAAIRIIYAVRERRNRK